MAWWRRRCCMCRARCNRGNKASLTNSSLRIVNPYEGFLWICHYGLPLRMNHLYGFAIRMFLKRGNFEKTKEVVGCTRKTLGVQSSSPKGIDGAQIWAHYNMEPNLGRWQRSRAPSTVPIAFVLSFFFCCVVCECGHGKMQTIARRLGQQSLRPSTSLKSIYPISDHRNLPFPSNVCVSL